MKSLKDISILTILILAFSISAFQLWAFTSLLDSFPWGESNSYVIWEPLLLYFIVPPLILTGCCLIIFSTQRKYRLPGFHLLIIGLTFTLPSVFGFDLPTDLAGRWCGVLVSALAVLITTFDIFKVVREQAKKIKHL